MYSSTVQARGSSQALSASHAPHTRVCSRSRQSLRIRASALSVKQACTAGVSAAELHCPASTDDIYKRLGVAGAAGLLATTLLISPCSAADKSTAAGQNVGFASDSEVLKQRTEHHFMRSFDGRVALQNKQDKSWYDLKVEPAIPGALLFRGSDGQVFTIGYSRIRQMDLSDDAIVAIVSDDEWEKTLQPIEVVESESTKAKGTALQLDREEFYSLFSLSQEFMEQAAELEKQ